MTADLSYPPTTTQLSFEFSFAPVSLQSTPEAKVELRNRIRSITAKSEFYLSGEVEIEIVWQLHERERYQGVHSPDIDNILKPIVDALSGPDGLLVNDCQAQSVRCSWIDWLEESQRLLITLRFGQDDYVRKHGLEWVEIADKLCIPIYDDLPPDNKRVLLEAVEQMFAARRQALDMGVPWGLAQLTMPVVQPFHRARLQGFKVVLLDEVLGRGN